MRNRVNPLGVSEPEIRKQGKDQIVIELAGVHDLAKAAKIIGTTGQLQFYDFENDAAGPSSDGQGNVTADPNLYHLLQQVQSDAKSGTPSAYYLFDAKHRVNGASADSRAHLLEAHPKLKGKLPKGWTILAVPQHMTAVSCTATPTNRLRRRCATRGNVLLPVQVLPQPGRAPSRRSRGRSSRAARSAPRSARRRVRETPSSRSASSTRATASSRRSRRRRPRTGRRRPTRPGRAAQPTWPPSPASHGTSRSCSTASSSRRRTSTTSRTRTASTRASTAPRSPASTRSARRRTWRSSSNPARCPTSSSRSSRPTSRRRSARTR